jgi:hypothetical protein
MGRREMKFINVVDKKRLRTEKVQECQSIIHGSFHQGDAKFSQLSGGKQCTANAAVSISMSISNPVTSWTTDIVDIVLNYGNLLYIDSIAKRAVVQKN